MVGRNATVFLLLQFDTVVEFKVEGQ